MADAACAHSAQSVLNTAVAANETFFPDIHMQHTCDSNPLWQWLLHLLQGLTCTIQLAGGM